MVVSAQVGRCLSAAMEMLDTGWPGRTGPRDCHQNERRRESFSLITLHTRGLWRNYRFPPSVKVRSTVDSSGAMTVAFCEIAKSPRLVEDTLDHLSDPRTADATTAVMAPAASSSALSVTKITKHQSTPFSTPLEGHRRSWLWPEKARRRARAGASAKCGLV